MREQMRDKKHRSYIRETRVCLMFFFARRIHTNFHGKDLSDFHGQDFVFTHVQGLDMEFGKLHCVEGLFIRDDILLDELNVPLFKLPYNNSSIHSS